MPTLLLSISVAYKILTLVYPIEIETLDMEAVNAKAQTGPMTMKEIKFIVLFSDFYFIFYLHKCRCTNSMHLLHILNLAKTAVFLSVS